MQQDKGRTELVKVRVGAVQMVSDKYDQDKNIERALGWCDQAAKHSVEILCFPEWASTGFEIFGLQQEEICTEPVPGPMVEKFAKKAKKTDMYVIMGVVERPSSSSKTYNTAFLVGPQEGYIGRHRKVFVKPMFEPGREAEVFDTRYGRIGIIICRDIRSPELSRLLVLKGARILFQPSNYGLEHYSGYEGIKRYYMGKHTAQRARAMDNGVHLVIANGGRKEYVNDSRIIGPDRQGPEPVLARANRKEQLIFADIEFDPRPNIAAAQARRTSWLFGELANEIFKTVN